MAIFKIIDYKPLFYYEGINHVEDTIKNAIRYVTNPISNPNQIYRGYNFLCTTPDDIITQFIAVSRYYGKRDYIPIRHLVLSLNPYNPFIKYKRDNFFTKRLPFTTLLFFAVYTLQHSVQVFSKSPI